MAGAGPRGGGSRSSAARRGGPRRPSGRRLRRAPGASRTTIDGRVRLLRTIFVIAFVLIGGKAIALASTQGNLIRIAHSQQVRTVVLPAHRGSIVDRQR